MVLKKAMSMPVLPHEDFKALIDHHLNATEWKYATPGLFPGQGLDGPICLMSGLEGAAAEAHPVHVTLPQWGGEPMGEGHGHDMGDRSALGIEGLPLSMPMRCECSRQERR